MKTVRKEKVAIEEQALGSGELVLAGGEGEGGGGEGASVFSLGFSDRASGGE